MMHAIQTIHDPVLARRTPPSPPHLAHAHTHCVSHLPHRGTAFQVSGFASHFSCSTIT